MIALLAFAIGISWGDIPRTWHDWIARDEGNLRLLLAEIDRRTDERVREGEWDHFVYYVLQSRAFTKISPVEPALSSRELHETGRVPAGVAGRVDEFLTQAAPGGPPDPRFQWARRQTASASWDKLLDEYRRAMKFLYEKEWASRERSGAGRRAAVAQLYRERGHSSDTSVSAADTLKTGIAVLRGLYPRQPLTKTLVIGPGLDWAPRTGLNETSPPRSYQMELLPEAACADVNPRVIKALDCEKLNIITERLERQFDLIVITNVLLYFDDKELALALVNIHSMLKPGGFLLHNELRPEVEKLCRDLGMPAVHARTLQAAGSPDLYDAVVIHRRAE